MRASDIINYFLAAIAVNPGRASVWLNFFIQLPNSGNDQTGSRRSVNGGIQSQSDGCRNALLDQPLVINERGVFINHPPHFGVAAARIERASPGGGIVGIETDGISGPFFSNLLDLFQTTGADSLTLPVWRHCHG